MTSGANLVVLLVSYRFVFISDMQLSFGNLYDYSGKCRDDTVQHDGFSRLVWTVIDLKCDGFTDVERCKHHFRIGCYLKYYQIRSEI